MRTNVTIKPCDYDFRICTEPVTRKGDSGSPLFCERNGKFMMVGILSGGTSEVSFYVDLRFDFRSHWLN